MQSKDNAKKLIYRPLYAELKLARAACGVGVVSALHNDQNDFLYLTVGLTAETFQHTDTMALASQSIGKRVATAKTTRPVARPAPFRSLRKAATVHVVADAATAAPAAAALSTEKTGPSFKALRDINQIMGTLPHRYIRKGSFGCHRNVCQLRWCH